MTGRHCIAMLLHGTFPFSCQSKDCQTDSKDCQTDSKDCQTDSKDSQMQNSLHTMVPDSTGAAPRSKLSPLLLNGGWGSYGCGR